MLTPPIFIKFIKRKVDILFHETLRYILVPQKKGSTKTIVIVRTDGIGDFVYFVKYLKLIRERYKGYRIVLCCREESAKLAEGFSLIDKVVGFNVVRCRRHYLYRLRTLANIRSTTPKVAIYASYHREQIGDELTLFSGATDTVAFSGNDECIHPSLRLRNNLEYAKVVEVSDHIPEQMKYAKMMEALDCGVVHDGEDDNLLNELIPSVTEKVPHAIAAMSSKPYILLGPGGSGPIRRWPIEMFSALADELASRYKFDIVLCGNREENNILLGIAKRMRTPATVYSSLGLREVVQIMRKATAFVGNESGLLHLAASIGTPSVGILGGGHFSRYFPYGSAKIVNHALECYECNWSCKFPEPYCITNITVDDVLAVFKKLNLHKA